MAQLQSGLGGFAGLEGETGGARKFLFKGFQKALDAVALVSVSPCGCDLSEGKLAVALNKFGRTRND